MQLTVSLGNSKIGKVPNLSFPPGASCVKRIPCYEEGCYARNAYRRFKNVVRAWEGNLVLYKTSPYQFMSELWEWLYTANYHTDKVQMFRFFVGGDLPDEDFLCLMKMTAEEFYGTTFLAFTKRYDYDYSGLPQNLKIVLSTWPGLELPKNPLNLPMAWLEEDDRRPQRDAHICSGGCTECDHYCWHTLAAGGHVTFPRH